MVNRYVKMLITISVAGIAGAVLLYIDYYLPDLLHFDPMMSSPNDMLFPVAAILSVVSFFMIPLFAGNLSVALSLRSIRSLPEAFISGIISGAIAGLIIGAYAFLSVPPAYQSDDPAIWILIFAAGGALLGLLGATVFYIFNGDLINKARQPENRRLPLSTAAMAALIPAMVILSIMLAAI